MLMYYPFMARWSLLGNHGRSLPYITRDPKARLSTIAAALGVTQRSANAIVSDLAKDDYITRVRDGRRNRYQYRPDAPSSELPDRDVAIGEVLDVLIGFPARSETGFGRS